MNNQWTTLPSDDVIKKTSEALQKNGISPSLVSSGIEAESQIQSIIPKGSSVMNGSSTTLKQIGFLGTLKSGKHPWNNLHESIIKETNQHKQSLLSKEASLADYYLGSVHAVTEDGAIVIASNSGSQLPAYAYNAAHLIWVVGAQKIVKNLDEAFERIYDYVLPLESERAKKAYGVPGSFVSKVLIINRENVPDRIKLIFVKEVLGF